MNDPYTPIPTNFGTVGPLARQVRQLLNAAPLPPDADERATAFCIANTRIGLLAPEFDCRAWMYLEADSDDNPVLVLAGVASGVAVYLTANLAERCTVNALALALRQGRIELVLASPGGASSHQFNFPPTEEKYLENVLAEHLEFCPEYDRDWLAVFNAEVPKLPTMCQHLHPALAACERHVCIVLQGNYGNHLRSVSTGLQRSVGV